MSHAVRLAAALAVLGLATPALPCDCQDHEKATKTTTASTEKATKAKAKKAKAPAKPAPEQKPVTAAN
jgi:hypothetical protein